MKRWIGRLGLGFALGMALVGCAQEREPINRVQANALKKSFFVGEDLKSTTDDPEFYKRDTVIDVGYGAAQDGLFTATYAQPISRIRWEVTEGMLNARLSYERIKDTDGKGEAGTVLKPKASNDGQIVASYRITSHFDVRRSYNPSTGEEQNVVEENTSDRPWYEREYFRVEWGTNLVTDAYDFDTLSMMGVYGGLSYEPIGYTVNEKDHPDAPHFADAGDYFDVTNKVFATPQMIDLSSLGWGIDKFPACMLPGEFSGGTQPYGNCNPTEVTLRSSFKKVVDKDFEPKNDDGQRFGVAGAFETEYHGYERNYGMLDNQWYRFISKYNIWNRSHFYADPAAMTGPIKCATKETTEDKTGDPTADPNRDLDKDGTSDECAAAGAGSRCDIFTQKCTLPYAKREVAPIPWYIGGDTNEDYFEATNWATLEWDVALKAAIQSSRLVECRRTKGVDCEGQFPMWTGQQDDNDEAIAISRTLNACRRANGPTATQCNDEARAMAANVAKQRGNPNDKGTLAIGEVVSMPTVITLCHNPVVAGDHPVCGPVGLHARIGDLRYNSVHNIALPQQPSSWGIMVDADDPLTGEKVAASINIWTHVTDVAAQGLVDLVRYANGELSTADVTDGKYVTNWSAASKLTNGANSPTLSKEEVTGRLATVAGMDTSAFKKKLASKSATEVAQAVEHKIKPDVRSYSVDSRIASPARAAVNANLKALRGSPIESELMNQPMLQMAGIKGDMPLQGTIADRASPLAMNSERVRSQMKQMKENGLAAHGTCILNEAPEASSMAGLADALKEKFPIPANETGAAKHERHEHMLRYVRRMYHYAVIAHEMGHSVGLRHNFVSSSGPLHYRPQYWQLRTKNGTINTICEGPDNGGLDENGNEIEAGANCVGPRYYDPVTKAETAGILPMYMHSTVMDYPGDVSQDFVGLGAYDFHAARMFYGDTATVYRDDAFKVGTPNGTGILQATDTFGGLAGIKYSQRVDTAQGASTETFHYSELQNRYGMIKDCYDIQPTQPATWDESKDGKWSPSLDGHLVSIDGKTTKCRQQPIDYVDYSDLRNPTTEEYTNAFYRGGAAVDTSGRTRVPYHFATDHWADTGNVSVFRHDNGADPYEQMMFLITTSETRHVFDNYRRNRTTFDVKAASDRYYGRYNEKILGIASGMAFLANIYKNLATNSQVFGGAQAYGATADTFVPYILTSSYQDNILASSMAFDHFAKVLSRPQPGPHYFRHQSFNDPVLYSNDDAEDFGPGTIADADGNMVDDIAVTIPNGATGNVRDITFGGRPLNNSFAEDKGDFNTSYTIGAGAYYSKASVMGLLSESEDRYISSSRQDFLDARFRANGLPDIFSDGYRRLLANALVGDRSMLAPHLVAKKGKPEVTASTDPGDSTQNYPAQPLAWTSWWPAAGPKVCLPSNGRNVCYGPGSDQAFGGETLAGKNLVAVDPQVGWEVQKFLIVHSLAGLRETAVTGWMDMMAMYKAGPEAGPTLDGRLEWMDPQSGQLYYAKSIGKECLFGDAANNCAGGKLVEKGIAARMLEYANELTVAGYKLDKVAFPKGPKNAAGFNEFGRPMVARHPDNAPIIKTDPTLLDYFSYGVIDSTNHNFEPCEPSSDNAACVSIHVFIDPTTDNYAFDTADNITFCDPAAGETLGFVWDEKGAGYALEKNGENKGKMIPCELVEGDATCRAANCQKVSMPQQVVDCDQNTDATCKQITVEKNHFAMALKKYKSLPEFLREAGMRMGRFGSPGKIGIY